MRREICFNLEFFTREVWVFSDRMLFRINLFSGL